ncbi:hypothetical protein SAMD00019534_104930 [Acytostelium subglobosum LB1]|uniref:hypothetical protein n=1 Tax=Acytostelium subglobosum LB1 TaxID=1410327 RepID=UPI0006450F66|nr:hypothetical protein SAMD00019534_104930 [Acytostelium subglobosum LB1]GAM27318.1 hypothetical protein SAMD00019534_104930 [Acytostelium subglobosum LB1]|eukprot:XP_012749785.1 hypothetical protein SAMD00019534_104930 [Acytostelium subglobosum LB1]
MYVYVMWTSRFDFGELVLSTNIVSVSHSSIQTTTIVVTGSRVCRSYTTATSTATLPNNNNNVNNVNNVITTLKSRGFVYQMTGNEEELIKLTSQPIALYAGFDPTADSLHIGNLLMLMALLHFQRSGHKPVALLGGATGLIGDPSGKSTERPQLDTSFVVDNTSHIRENIAAILGNDATIVNNIDWSKNLSIIDFFRDTARYFRVGSMLRKDFVNNRVGTMIEQDGKKHLVLNDDESSGTGISLPEFCYSLFQANDYVHLHKTHGCVIQIGGSDQWGNITDGCDLIKKKLNKQAYGITIPLLTNSQGKKLGKSEGNSIWLSPQRTSPYNFYQYFIQIADEDVDKLLKYFTFLSLEEIAAVVKQHAAEPHLRLGQRKLAECVTELVHGRKGLDEAINTTSLLFGDKLMTGGSESETKEIGRLLNGVNAIKMPRSMHVGGGDKQTTVLNLFVQVSGMSKNQAKLLLKNQSIYINGEPVKTFDQVIEPGDLICNDFVHLRSGKKAYYLIKFT